MSATLASSTDVEAALQIAKSANGASTAKRNLYVSNIDVCVSEPELVQLFLQYGPVETHKLMVNIKTGQSRGFGFIMYENAEDAAAAAAGLDGFPLYDRQLEVRLADDKTRTPKTPTASLLIRNLPAQAVPNIADLCAEFGEVERVAFYLDPPKTIKSAITAAATRGTDPHIIVLVVMKSSADAVNAARSLNNSLRFAAPPPTTVSGDAVDSRRPLQAKVLGDGEEELVLRKYTPVTSTGAAMADPSYLEPRTITDAFVSTTSPSRPPQLSQHQSSHQYHHHPVVTVHTNNINAFVSASAPPQLRVGVLPQQQQSMYPSFGLSAPSMSGGLGMHMMMPPSPGMAFNHVQQPQQHNQQLAQLLALHAMLNPTLSIQ